MVGTPHSASFASLIESFNPQRATDPFGLGIWNRVLVAEIEIIPQPFLILRKVADSDLPLIEVGHILSKNGVRDKKHKISFDRIY